jgi:tetratricopeptide (TPR) repeat protein
MKYRHGPVREVQVVRRSGRTSIAPEDTIFISYIFDLGGSLICADMRRNRLSRKLTNLWPHLLPIGHNRSMSMRWDETWHRLKEWTAGQGPSERLAAQILLGDGFTQADPSHPLGGRDGKKDAIAWRANEKWVMAVYFPRGKIAFREIKQKFITDYAGVAANGASALAFVTNQELSLNERAKLNDSITGSAEIYHLERITAILDRPAMQSVRMQFLGISGGLDTSKSRPVFVHPISTSLPTRGSLVGRARELEVLSHFLAQEQMQPGVVDICVITGMPGVGKTALAFQAAGDAVRLGLFRGGAIAVDCNGYAVDIDDQVRPQQFLSSALLALGCTDIEPDPGSMSVRFQSILAELLVAGKRALLLFDNVSQVCQIEPLVPSSRGHKMIVTSRNALAPRLASSDELRVAPLDINESIDLIARTSASPQEAGAWHGNNIDSGLERLAAICGGLPIALELVGEILRNEQALTPSEFAEELDSESTRLGGLEFEDSTLRAVFSGSYARLAEAVGQCFRYISIHPAQEFSVDSLAAILKKKKLEVRRAFRSLEGSHLIVRELDRSTWKMHDLLRLYSAERFGLEEGPSAATAALSSLNEYYFTTAEQANEWLNAASSEGERGAFQSRSDALAWLATEKSGIAASIEVAARVDDFHNAWRLGITMSLFLDITGDRPGCLSMGETALSAARALRDDEREASALNNVGLALNSMQRFSEAKGIFLQARKKYRELGDRSGEARILQGLCDVLRAEGSIEETIVLLERAIKLYMDDGNAQGAGFALTNLGISLREGAKFKDAVQTLLLALKIHEETGARRAESSTLVQLGTALMQSGRNVEGITYLTRGRDCAREVGDMGCFIAACANIGNMYRQLGDAETAKKNYLEAVNVCEAAGNFTDIALVLWNLIGLSQGIKEYESASRYLRYLQSIPRDDLPLTVRRGLYGDG